jgi:hypothetical protein
MMASAIEQPRALDARAITVDNVVRVFARIRASHDNAMVELPDMAKKPHDDPHVPIARDEVARLFAGLRGCHDTAECELLGGHRGV